MKRKKNLPSIYCQQQGFWAKKQIYSVFESAISQSQNQLVTIFTDFSAYIFCWLDKYYRGEEGATFTNRRVEEHVFVSKMCYKFTLTSKREGNEGFSLLKIQRIWESTSKKMMKFFQLEGKQTIICTHPISGRRGCNVTLYPLYQCHCIRLLIMMILFSSNSLHVRIQFPINLFWKAHH